jgi:hypothetical protein
MQATHPHIALVGQLASKRDLHPRKTFGWVHTPTHSSTFKMRGRIDQDTYLTRKDRVQDRHFCTRVQEDASTVVVHVCLDDGLLVRLLRVVAPIPSAFPWSQCKSLDNLGSLKLFLWFNRLYYRVT